jgi:glyoxylase-like metal-dependent hydrolase (beta-lactamase superfamily II)/rhodanese-related sulfurtransferase
MENANLFFRQYYLQCLSHASYLIGDRSTGKAIVVDPQRDVDQYIIEAAEEGLSITSVFETHFHADFLSGHLELASKVGAEIVYGHGAYDRVDFPIRTMKHGEHFSLGRVDIELLETPGHTPESACLVIRPEGPNSDPYGVCTGDTLFIGDVGRPDLLSSVGFTADDLAHQLYDSVHNKLMLLPNETKVYPAHGAGSACGKNLSTETVSTIGEQRRTNYALAPMMVTEFVEAITQGQSVAPLYFLFAATKNRQAHELFVDNSKIDMLNLDEVLKAKLNGAVIIDSRDDMSFAAGHLRGSVNVGLSGRFAEYVGEVMEPGTPIVLVCEPGTENEAITRLARIGFDNVVGALSDPTQVFFQHPTQFEQQSRLSVTAFNDRISTVNDIVVVDIRNPSEVELGSIPQAIHISLPSLLKRMNELDKCKPIVVFCAGGYRSSIASSLLKSHGFTDVSDLIGGYSAWIGASS